MSGIVLGNHKEDFHGELQNHGSLISATCKASRIRPRDVLQALRRLCKRDQQPTTRISEFIQDAKVDQEEMPAYSELTRRLGFEYNGMVLHEYYFENLKKGGGTGDPTPTSQFAKAAEASFGSYDIWKADFVGIGKMRGVGWAICYENQTERAAFNHWITLHETGNVAGFIPILVMDVWEHAFLLDRQTC